MSYRSGKIDINRRDYEKRLKREESLFLKLLEKEEECCEDKFISMLTLLGVEVENYLKIKQRLISKGMIKLTKIHHRQKSGILEII